MNSASVAAELATLRARGRLDEARAVLGGALREQPQDEALRRLAWQHAPVWWQPLAGPRARLERRGPDDAAFVRRCWADGDFMARFNRLAAPLPAGDDALRALLAGEQRALIADSRAIHWTIHDAAGPAGFVSLVDISFSHRRAEFLIGVLPQASRWLAPEAAHLAIGFAAGPLKLERLSAHFYPQNVEAQRIAQKFGFEREGLLRGYLRLPGSGERCDLVIAGLLLDDAYFARSARQRERLLGRDSHRDAARDDGRDDA
ncbi:GNAT family N-acetyltransferase [Aquabacterium humicola]|uniref:GNAT family N-acetyltransferase n=1 Tax=Aquabacterium humicola TaxID=3237377 RepID=UPI002543B482|nr:GNAT family N-acetyltransferase [Rubrivivax pictus]